MGQLCRNKPYGDSLGTIMMFLNLSGQRIPIKNCALLGRNTTYGVCQGPIMIILV